MNTRNMESFLRDHDSFSLTVRWALASLHWDFGAVDVMMDRGGRPILLEANSAPALLDTRTRECYATRLKAIL